MTNAERKLWSALRRHGLAGAQFRRQAPCGPYIADFLCHGARLVVEVDGATHSTEAERSRDAKRDAWFAANGYAVLRVTNAEVYEQFEGVLETVWMRAAERLPPPQPSPASREREEIRRFIGISLTPIVSVPSAAKPERDREGTLSPRASIRLLSGPYWRHGLSP